MDHLDHEHGHDHDAGGGHGHDHGHSHSEAHLEQLLTVGICGTFGVVAMLLGRETFTQQKGMLSLILAEPFWIWVFVGGVVLVLLAIIQGVALWRKVGQHEHGEDCGHDHGGEHAVDHTHGSAFWRVVVLMFPLAMFFMDLPNKGFSQERVNKMLGADIEISPDSIKDIESRGDVNMTFADISAAMNDPAQIDSINGLTVTLKGQMRLRNDREFTLYTLKMTCCAADAVPLKARIIVQTDEQGGSLSSKGFTNGAWVEVTGVMQFVHVPETQQPLLVIRAKLGKIVPTEPE